jgi:cytochrome c oxidase assembly protein subunit 15
MAIITTIAVYVLIVVGSSVRASGAGMGCPDWPTCFGQWIPPTDVSQLPSNYQEIYKERGYANVAFNPVKTWTEYFNRLTGATIGILVFITLIFAWMLRKEDGAAFKASLAAFVLVGFNGWLGSVVVSSNLHPTLITTHMFAALLTIAALIYATMRAWGFRVQPATPPSKLLVFALTAGIALTLAQVALGTQVREAVDVLALNPQYSDRSTWFSGLGSVLYSHIALAVLVLVWNLWVVLMIWKSAGTSGVVQKLSYALIAIVIAQILIGISFKLFNFPAVLQPAHLLGGSLIFGVQFALLIALRNKKRADSPAAKVRAL